MCLPRPFAGRFFASTISLRAGGTVSQHLRLGGEILSWFDERGDAIDITTTDIHLPRRIGEAVKRAHDGALTIDFGKDAYEIRVRWER